MCQLTFSKKVLDLTKKIPLGTITTYAELSKATGSPRAHRAVGNALNRNTHPVTIPCHRVIRSDGTIGGYSRGKKEKIALLEKEGIPVENGKVAFFAKYLHRFKN